jgi:predicted acylesterase/phospholipase RssA
VAKRTDEDYLREGKHALVLGGGAPTLTLMAGALLALDELGVEFDVVSTSGAGMLVGLLYAAPKGGDRRAALRATVHLGVHDDIYRHFPINYKVFYKPGPLAEMWLKTYMPWLQAMPQETSEQRLLRDLVHLWCASVSPSSLTPDSLGMCAPAPWLEEVVDFAALKRFAPDFFINAWNIRERRMRVFEKEEITPAHFRTALAFPLIYPPFELDGDWYIEGSAMDTLNLKGLLAYDRHYDQAYPELLRAELARRWPEIRRYRDETGLEPRERAQAIEELVDEAEWAAHEASLRARVRGEASERALQEASATFAQVEERELRSIKAVADALDYERKSAGEINAISRIVVFDVLGTDRLVRKPRNLYDAWVLQMIVPLVSISNENIKAFERDYDYPEGHELKYLHRLRFDDQISHEDWPNVLDWSYSNLKTLFDAGYRAGRRFHAEHAWLRRGGPG